MSPTNLAKTNEPAKKKQVFLNELNDKYKNQQLLQTIDSLAH